MQKGLPQGLKPDASNAVMSELKLRPPKNLCFSAASEAVPSRKDPLEMTFGGNQPAEDVAAMKKESTRSRIS